VGILVWFLILEGTVRKYFLRHIATLYAKALVNEINYRDERTKLDNLKSI
jgi:hypothetical protein